MKTLHVVLLASLTSFAGAMLLPTNAAFAANLAEELNVPSLVARIKSVGSNGAGHGAAIAAMRDLSAARMNQVSEILAGMDGADKLATNWLRAAVETVVQRQIAKGEKLPVDSLELFLADTNHSPHARRLAYELIKQHDDSAEQRLIPRLLNDPSLELRRDAVSLVVKEADGQVAENKSDAIAHYHRALSAARDIDQIEEVAKKLRELGETVDLPSHFGFVMQWHLAGPFDNTGKKGFDVAYAPEKTVDLAAEYPGKDGPVKWLAHATKDEFGTVDLTKALAPHKGAITYAYAEFNSDQAQRVELRLGCINANKVWLNGKLLTSNEVYHANTQIDQYIGIGQLKDGRNQILLKICQNEQEESWAQRWQFQLRVCDQYGTAILSTDRPASSTVSSK